MHCAPRKKGFTLVELLVVIGIIALLISILLPALTKARKAANTIKCAANLRSITQAMQVYAAQNSGAIPGTGWTTGRFFYSNPATAAASTVFNENNCPSVVQVMDWQSPIAKIMGVKFEEGGSLAQRKARFESLRELPAFTCPDNEILAVPFTSNNVIGATAGRMISYNTPAAFMVQRNNGSAPTLAVGRTISRIQWNVPSGYSPKVSKVGQPSRKVYIADGAKYATTSGTGPDFQTNFTQANGGAYADQAPCTPFTGSWVRALAPGNGGSGFDARIFAFRHGGKPIQKGTADSYRINLAFFDGHVETLGDLEASRPEFWFPKGTELENTAAQLYTDVRDKYLKGVGVLYIVP